MVKIQADDKRLRDFLSERIKSCSSEMLADTASVLLSTNIIREGHGFYTGEIDNREVVRDEELFRFLTNSDLDSELLEVASTVDPGMELSVFRSTLRLKLLKHGLTFDEDTFTSLCNQVRNNN